MNNKGELIHISGDTFDRFVLHSALLRLIDPVRGKPTRSTLDENPDGSFLGAWQLQQRFLDSFALICSTSSSGAETATAVCLETYDQVGNVLRLARNHGLAPEHLAGLKRVLQVLQEASRKEKPSTQAETEILQLVAELDKGRILSIAERIKKRGILRFLQKAQSEVHDSQLQSEKFRIWLENCPFTASPSLIQNWTGATTVKLIHWASEARWHYAEQLRTLLKLVESQSQAWLDNLHKVARYHSAIKSMVKFAVKEPGIFVKIVIRPINAPNPRRFKFPNDEAPLLAVVRALVGKDTNMTMEKLEKHLGTQDVEARLRKACHLELTLHAEMQIVVFYEGNPGLAPHLRLIGTSKKACFLCDKYLRHHPLRLQASACHQKIYPSWMPPPYYKVPGKSTKLPFIKLSGDIEKLTRQELKAALTAPLRPPNYDSTAGPSLTLTATVPTELRSLRETRAEPTVGDDRFSEDSD
ncbi:hypothetical protein FOXG_07475 [Fusarium oxysporum f. sp. lycopersici 4287]|uniref:Uncharacterized protein n=1 Tax=Fusarium oxysporum f. sp. lycopersici (strain 4287 / CBS 123668 / FGSC 9935 / NRRL 34936) TaxID=426428 RepID=A0A0J9V1D2_FUSO4|nr:hypothetical protein FOXG_07475 [Fusarium oxysporum f. sp. lycopersici 4287]KAJ9426121.1 hypothetical protein QL093DRAFT_1166417 [Fusarium oxysporum]KNB05115.1 hypothetical protein FOXG_07475 [Fusarium oxysporum f. sp. lycopersici 4287]